MKNDQNIKLFKLSVMILFALLCVSCSGNKDIRKMAEMPYFMDNEKGVFINTFSLGQGDFPRSAEDSLDKGEGWVMLDEAKALEVLQESFKSQGVELQKDYLFSVGKLDVKLDGYDDKRSTGFAYITIDDYETPKKSPDGGDLGKFAYFFTEKSPEKFSLAELSLVDQYCLYDQYWVALINGHQIGWTKSRDDKWLAKIDAIEDEAEKQAQSEEYEKAMTEKDAKAEALQIRRLKARSEMFLSWVRQRLLKKNAKVDKANQ